MHILPCLCSPTYSSIPFKRAMSSHEENDPQVGGGAPPGLNTLWTEKEVQIVGPLVQKMIGQLPAGRFGNKTFQLSPVSQLFCPPAL